MKVAKSTTEGYKKMTDRVRLFSKSLFASTAPFSHVAVSDTGLTFISGLIGQTRDTGALVSRELRPQATAMFENLTILLSECGLTTADLLRVTIYLTSYDDFADINEIYREFVPSPYPARVTIQVAGLPLGARIQLDAVAENSSK